MLKKGKLWAIYSILTHSHLPRVNQPRVNNFENYHFEIKTHGIDQTNSPKVDDIEKLEELNCLFMNIFHVDENKTVTQKHMSKKPTKRSQ